MLRPVSRDCYILLPDWLIEIAMSDTLPACHELYGCATVFNNTVAKLCHVLLKQ